MAKRKLNCWEYLKCGRQPDGDNVNEKGVCPASIDGTFDGLNGGCHGGRFCWGIAGTLCEGKIQGTFAEKRGSCMNCPFYKLVHQEQVTTNRRTKFLRFVIGDTGPALLEGLKLKTIPAGTRFIVQGSTTDEAYIIQQGAAIELVEREGVLHPAAFRVEGDMVGIMGILIGGAHTTHVEAETDMEVWILPRERLARIPEEDPDLHILLTELVADRFDTMRPIARMRIGKYEATDIIGRGAYSIVYRGHHVDLHLPVAIKMMRHDLALDEGFITSFRNEAKIIASLDHENIFRIYDIEEQYKTLFIIMEYVLGESLEERMKAETAVLTSWEVVNLLVGICKGLDYAHGRGLIHRDINPKNIILGEGKVKIVDFGLACPMGTEDIETMGTVHYAPPEQIDGLPMDRRTDIYALGIMAYEMVTGEKPFREEKIEKVMDAHMNCEIPDPAEIIPDLPGSLRTFITKACRRNPEERFQNVGEILDLLVPLANESGGAAVRPARGSSRCLLEIFYNAAYRKELEGLLKEFNAKAGEFGAALEVADERSPFNLGNGMDTRPKSHAISHIGKKRTINEDRYLIRELGKNAILLAVADGMGGGARGDLAAEFMVERLTAMNPGKEGVERRLTDVVRDADKALFSMAEREPELEGMGTTVTGCLISGNRAWWVQVGDSRLYLLRQGIIRQVTVDQNMVQFLIDEGDITLQEARNHPARHLLDQCVGCGHCEPETGSMVVEAGDLLLFATDGLHEDLSLTAINALLYSDTHVRDKAGALIQGALRGGGNDNITVVVVEL